MRVPFDPPAGLVSDDTIYATPGAWTSMSNMRFWEGRPQTIGGWQSMFSSTLTGVCRAVHSWTNIAGVQNTAFGTHSALQVYVGGIFATITPSGLAAGSIDTSGGGPGYGTGTYGSGTYSVPTSSFLLRTWCLDTWGETLVAVPQGDTLYQWSNDTATLAVAIANAPDQITAMLVTAERQVLALGCNEEVSNDFNSLCIRGSDIENLTVWTTSATNNAFEYILEGGGQIVTGRRVGAVIGVWTDNSLHQGIFLGNPDQTYRFDRIDENCGILGPNAVAVLKGVAYWVGKDRQFRAWLPGSPPRIVPCPILTEFKDNLYSDQATKLVATSNTRFDEVWFYYPDSRDGTENSRYIALSVASDAPVWTTGELARTAACDAGVMTNPIGVTVDGVVYYHEIGTTADMADLVWSARSAAQYLDEAETVLQAQRLRPDFKSQDNDISLTVYARSHPQATPVTKGPYTIAPNTAKKDIRFSGAIMELEWSGTGYARFGKPTFDTIQVGSR